MMPLVLLYSGHSTLHDHYLSVIEHHILLVDRARLPLCSYSRTTTGLQSASDSCSNNNGSPVRFFFCPSFSLFRLIAGLLLRYHGIEIDKYKTSSRCRNIYITPFMIVRSGSCIVVRNMRICTNSHPLKPLDLSLSAAEARQVKIVGYICT